MSYVVRMYIAALKYVLASSFFHRQKRPKKSGLATFHRIDHLYIYRETQFVRKLII